MSGKISADDITKEMFAQKLYTANQPDPDLIIRPGQGLGCSPIKAVRELGSERRETVRSLSGAGVGYLKGAGLSTRGPGWTNLWFTGCHTSGIAG